METNTSKPILKKLKEQWLSIVLVALIAIVFVVYLFHKEKTDSNITQEQSTATISPTANSELDVAKDNALNNPNFYTYLNLGVLYHLAGQEQYCINVTLRALEYPAPPEKQALAYNNLCAAYNVLKMWDEAIKNCEQALRLQPDFERAKSNLKTSISEKRKISVVYKKVKNFVG